jgi:hypothetical protein
VSETIFRVDIYRVGHASILACQLDSSGIYRRGERKKVDFGKRERERRKFVVIKTFRYIVQCVFVNVL